MSSFNQKTDVLYVDLNDCVMQNAEHICSMFPKLSLSDFEKWDTPLGGKVGMSNQDFLDLAYNTPATQLASEPHPGAAEKLTELKERGVKIVFLTATCMSVSQIITWLDEHNIPFDGIIKSKEKLGVYHLIDDNPKTLQERLSLDLPTIKFSRPWNDDINCPSISTWADLKI